jgi:hypothetical protein
MPADRSFISLVDQSIGLDLFGSKIVDLTLNKPAAPSRLGDLYPGKTLIFAYIEGARVLGKCTRFPSPVILLVPDTGTAPKGCDEFSDPKKYEMWSLSNTDTIATLSLHVMTVEQLASATQPRVDVTSDFRIYNVKVSGTVISGTVRAYLRLKQPGPFGSTIFDITVIDGNYNFSYDFSSLSCITVFTIAVASAQICYHANPNRICGEVSVGIDLPVIGHWGQNFTLACVNF